MTGQNWIIMAVWQTDKANWQIVRANQVGGNNWKSKLKLQVNWMNVSERYESAGLKFKLQLRMNWGNVEWSTEQFARDRNRQKVLLQNLRSCWSEGCELGGWLRGAVLKKRRAACSEWLGWELSVLVVGRWGLNIKGEFETLARTIIILRAPNPLL